MSATEGFTVNLDSLTAFAGELTTQLSGMTQPQGHLDTLTGSDIHLGQFPEADALWHNHDTAVEQMSVLVGQARDAIGFAEEITKSVSSAYQHFDDYVNTAINATGGTVEAVGQVVDGVVDGTVDSVDTVTDTVDTVTDTVGDTAGSIVSTVDNTVVDVIGALTGGVGDEKA